MNMIRFLLFISITVINCNAQGTSGRKMLDAKLIEELRIMSEEDQLYRKTLLLDTSVVLSKRERDSLWKLQHQIDERNIKRLMEIVEEHGYVDAGNSNSKAAVYIMFMHTPNQYKKEALKIIEKERKKRNIDKTSYDLISWHLKGREGLPFKIQYVQKNDSVNKQ